MLVVVQFGDRLWPEVCTSLAARSSRELPAAAEAPAHKEATAVPTQKVLFQSLVHTLSKMATLESIEELGACIKSTRKHLKALEEASAARRTDAGITDTAILQLVTSALTYHRKQYDVWMQMKLDRFADVSWDECHLEVPDESRKTSLESSPVRGHGAGARRVAGPAAGRPGL